MDIASKSINDITGQILDASEDPIAVANMQYFSQLRKLLSEAGDFDIVNFLVFREFIAMSRSANKEARYLMENWDESIGGKFEFMDFQLKKYKGTEDIVKAYVGN